MANLTDPSRPNFIPPCPPPAAYWNDGRVSVQPPTIRSRNTATSKHKQILQCQELPPRSVPPLAIYHICRICLRPRSERFHLEHPIPAQGLPPPPGICRRCRVTSESETIQRTTTTLQSLENPSQHDNITAEAPKINEKETVYVWPPSWECSSQAIKLGVGCMVPEEDRFSDLPTNARQSQRPQKSRIVNVGVGCIDSCGQNSDYCRRDHQSESAQRSEHASDLVQHHFGEVGILSSTNGDRLHAKTEATSAKLARWSTSASGNSSTSMNPKLHVSAEPDHEDTSALDDCQKDAELEGTIRKLARQEVERYRRAERLMNSHPNAYAHGRMVQITQKEKPTTVVAEVVRDQKQHSEHTRPQAQLGRFPDKEETTYAKKSSGELHSRSKTASRSPLGADEPEREYTYIRKTVQPAAPSSHSRVQFSDRVEELSSPRVPHKNRDRSSNRESVPRMERRRPLYQALSESPARERAPRQQNRRDAGDSQGLYRVDDITYSMRAQAGGSTGREQQPYARLRRRGSSPST